MLSTKLLRACGVQQQQGTIPLMSPLIFANTGLSPGLKKLWTSSSSFCPSFTADKDYISSKQQQQQRDLNNQKQNLHNAHKLDCEQKGNPCNFISLHSTTPTTFNKILYSRQKMFIRQIHTTSTIRSFAIYNKSCKNSRSINTEILPLKRCSQKRLLSTTVGNNGGDDGESKSGVKSAITVKGELKTRESVGDFLAALTDDQKSLLYHSLNVDVLRDKYEGHLGSSKSESHQYLSKFGRPSAVYGKEDPTGTLCEVPPKWLHARLGPIDGEVVHSVQEEPALHDEKSHPPAAGAIWAVGLKNALPFIGFGFLDNLIMILAGDWIDLTLGTALGISTMAAAALGNTISDVAGIGSAWYIEEIASKIGIKDPELTPSQFASWPIRWACNGGRAIGVVIGCLLGMFPLLFLPSSEEKEAAEKQKLEKEKAEKEKVAANSQKKDKN